MGLRVTMPDLLIPPLQLLKSPLGNPLLVLLPPLQLLKPIRHPLSLPLDHLLPTVQN